MPASAKTIDQIVDIIVLEVGYKAAFRIIHKLFTQTSSDLSYDKTVEALKIELQKRLTASFMDEIEQEL